MYQTVEHAEKHERGNEVYYTYTYSQQWSETPHNSQGFNDPNRRNDNLSSMAWPIYSKQTQAKKVHLGKFVLCSYQIN